MKPYCFDDKKISALMWVINESSTKDSINLHTIDVKFMGLQFSALFLSPFLNMGETYALFWPCGMHPSSIALFKKRAKGLDARSTNSIKIWGRILSA